MSMEDGPQILVNIVVWMGVRHVCLGAWMDVLVDVRVEDLGNWP